MTHELKARQEIDRLLTVSGWQVCELAQANIHAARSNSALTVSSQLFAHCRDRRLSINRTVEAEVDANLKRSQGVRQSVLQRAFCAS